MFQALFIMTMLSLSHLAMAKVGDTVIEQQTHNVNVTINDALVEAPSRPFDGDVTLSMGNDFTQYHLLPIPMNKITSYFAPGNTADVLLYEAKYNNGQLPAIFTSVLVDRIQEVGIQQDPKTCFHCVKMICAKGLAELVTLEFPAKNSNQKPIIFKSDIGPGQQYQEIPPENCKN